MSVFQAPASRHLKGEARFRLSGPKAFARVFTEGKRREGRYVQIIAAATSAAESSTAVSAAISTPCGHAGMVVSRKALSRAVDRNRFKRKVRETLRALRAADHPLLRADLVIRVKPALPRDAIDAAAAEVFSLMQPRAKTGTAR